MKHVIFLALALVTVLAQLVMLPWLMVLCAGSHPRGLRTLMAYDQALNALTGGSEDETVSSRAARARDSGRNWGCVFCRILDRIDPGHCDRSKGY